ncbi:hypothetical protein HRbin01_01195 [archaeon HR01]|nr:hypothetical protein HRbin01_01195 [archaeon HR01]
MDLGRWLEIYREICDILRIDPRKDIEAATILADIIHDRCLSRREIVELLGVRRAVAIFGAGPSLVKDLSKALPVIEKEEVLKIAVDGACRAFLEKGIVPDVVVTDLDGGDEYLERCSMLGSLMVVHAHGDNISSLLRVVPNLRGPILGTTQTKVVPPLENFGGFTDGDRAVCMFEELGYDTIIIAGMDFGTEIGQFSKPLPPTAEFLNRKIVKLKIGRKILENLACISRASFYDLTANSSDIPGFRKLGWEDIYEMLMSGRMR